MSEPTEDFRAAMRAAGLDYAGPINADGELHRFNSRGDHGRPCWYVVFLGPPLAGAFGCWKRGFKETWCHRNGKDYSAANWQNIKRRWAEAEQERERIEAGRQQKAKATAEWIWKRANPVTTHHHYLESKRVKPAGNMREYRGTLVVPLRDIEGHLHSLQFIAADGTKRFLRGGRVSGCFFAISGAKKGPAVVCEGPATGLSIHHATGYSVICAMNCGNLRAVAETVRAKLTTDREVVITADNDAWTRDNPGLKKATEAARAVGARVAVPTFKDTTTKPTDFNDLSTLEGADAVKAQIEAAQVPSETEDEMLNRLAKMTPLEYERARKEAGEKLRITRLSALDAEVDLRRPKSTSDSGQGTAVDLPSPEPWSEAVEGESLLDALAATFDRYMALPTGAAYALALWCAHTHCFSLFEHSPRLNLCSPDKGCGKTLALDIVACFVPRPLRTESITCAVLFRLVQKCQPTLLLDEVDAYLAENEELRGLLNGGHKRGAKAYRCEGDANEVRGFNAYAPAALAGIGHLSGTLHDRSVVIRLVRAKPGEVKARFNARHTEPEAELCRKLARWTEDNRTRLEHCDPQMPENAFNRLADNWRPLFVLAEVVGGDWPARAAAAFASLTATEDLDAQGLGAMLLADIREVFAREGQTRLASATLADGLIEFEGRPWPEFGRARKPITVNQLAQQLRKFRIEPRMMRIPGEQKNKRGYDLADFHEVFERFLPPSDASEASTLPTSENSTDFGSIETQFEPVPADETLV